MAVSEALRLVLLLIVLLGIVVIHEAFDVAFISTVIQELLVMLRKLNQQRSLLRLLQLMIVNGSFIR